MIEPTNGDVCLLVGWDRIYPACATISFNYNLSKSKCNSLSLKIDCLSFWMKILSKIIFLNLISNKNLIKNKIKTVISKRNHLQTFSLVLRLT